MNSTLRLTTMIGAMLLVIPSASWAAQQSTAPPVAFISEPEDPAASLSAPSTSPDLGVEIAAVRPIPPIPEAGAILGPSRPEDLGGFRWKASVSQNLALLAIMHGFRMTEGKTRAQLGGPFWSDYFESVKGFRGWSDGGKQFTNYVAHPAQGAVMGYTWVNNDPKSYALEIGASRAYWASRLKAFSWAFVWSTAFEIGPLSEASLGNVGQSLGRQAAVDFVITPTMGTGIIIMEDAFDRFALQWIERRVRNTSLRALFRLGLTPSRSFSNLLQLKLPWYRPTRPLVYTSPRL